MIVDRYDDSIGTVSLNEQLRYIHMLQRRNKHLTHKSG